MRARFEALSVAGLWLTSVMLLTGFAGAVTSCPGLENTQRRFRSVQSRTEAVIVSGWADASAGVSICAYQQTKDSTQWATLACTTPSSTSDGTDGCGVAWYPFTLSFTLLGNNHYWFGQDDPARGVFEYTRVSVNQSGNGGGLFTVTGDEAAGPSDGSSCYRSRARENGAVAPVVFYKGGLPAERECQSGLNSYDGCPFTCNLAEGCDASYGLTENNFYDSASRYNHDGQATVLTRFDHFGSSSAAGVPAGDWFYGTESGTCVGGAYPGRACDAESECDAWYSTLGYCGYRYYTVMRRNQHSVDSLNVRRGESRRNSNVVGWAKLKTSDSYGQEIGLISRHLDANNYFGFSVSEYGGDRARIHRYQGGAYAALSTSYPNLSLTGWTKLGFKIRDRGAYTASGFVPSGSCSAYGSVNDATVVSVAQTSCGFAPYGRYGTYSQYARNAQFYDLDAHPERPDLGSVFSGCLNCIDGPVLSR